MGSFYTVHTVQKAVREHMVNVKFTADLKIRL